MRFLSWIRGSRKFYYTVHFSDGFNSIVASGDFVLKRHQEVALADHVRELNGFPKSFKVIRSFHTTSLFTFRSQKFLDSVDHLAVAIEKLASAYKSRQA